MLWVKIQGCVYGVCLTSSLPAEWPVMMHMSKRGLDLLWFPFDLRNNCHMQIHGAQSRLFFFFLKLTSYRVSYPEQIMFLVQTNCLWVGYPGGCFVHICSQAALNQAWETHHCRNREPQRHGWKARRKMQACNLLAELNEGTKAEAMNSFLWELIDESLPWIFPVSSFVSSPMFIVFCIPN